MERWEREQKERILWEFPICWMCASRPALQLHHCIVHDMKRYHRELTTPENLMPICEVCHTSTEQIANDFIVRSRFALWQIERGLDVVGWYRALNLKVKEQWILELED